MPRNDQVTRQLILLRKLEGSRGATLQELFDTLPPDLVRHPRTIRRDLEALESTFPLITERKNGQTCWRLMDGYTNILPLALSTTELMALVFSKDLLKNGQPLAHQPQAAEDCRRTSPVEILGSVPRIVDADTLEVAGQKVRLQGIDAPESAQSCRRATGQLYQCGEHATQALRTRIGPGAVSCT